MRWCISPSRVSGAVGVPGDKSLSHRSLIMAAMAAGSSEIRGLSEGADVLSTADCLRCLGTVIRPWENSTIVESGGRFAVPKADLCAGNSGTTMRLLAGVLAGQPFTSCLTGDESLSRRPMERVAAPLRKMGASIATNDGTAPLEIEGARLQGIDYQTPVASAQLKSAVLLAGVYACDETTVSEPAPSRDHTERMLTALGVPVRVDGLTSSVTGGTLPQTFSASLPGDPSSAAFVLAAAALTGGHMTAENLLLNPTRIGFVRALERMGVGITCQIEREELGEPVGVVTVEGQPTHSISISAGDVPSLIDELPLIALLATQASGVTTVHGAEELRVKETDRIDSVVGSLSAMGAEIESLADGFAVSGPTALTGAVLDSRGDHRLAMMLAVAGLVASGTTTIEGAEAAAVSFPTFAAVLNRLGAAIEVG